MFNKTKIYGFNTENNTVSYLYTMHAYNVERFENKKLYKINIF